jgi:DNA-binding phage protein
MTITKTDVGLPTDLQNKEALAEHIKLILSTENPDLLRTAFAELVDKMGKQHLAESVCFATEVIHKLSYKKAEASYEHVKDILTRLVFKLQSDLTKD